MLKILKKNKKLKYKNQKKGIALVIAVTVMTLLLSISFSISNIVLRQIRITNINNESKPAFFIADSAIECVTYYDTLFIASSTDLDVNINKDFSLSIFGTKDKVDVISQIKCGNYLSSSPLNLEKVVSGDLTKVTTTFDILYDTDMCASVEVVRTELETNITARGYNTGINSTANGCDLSDLNNRRVIERGLTVKY
jgi:hypothetical protein